MRTFLDRWYGAAAAGLAIGLVLGFCVATAMGRNPVIGRSAYQTIIADAESGEATG
jgi:ABC-type nitrate/sulfonate/bicarbonate transport system permease component